MAINSHKDLTAQQTARPDQEVLNAHGLLRDCTNSCVRYSQLVVQDPFQHLLLCRDLRLFDVRFLVVTKHGKPYTQSALSNGAGSLG